MKWSQWSMTAKLSFHSHIAVDGYMSVTQTYIDTRTITVTHTLVKTAGTRTHLYAHRYTHLIFHKFWCSRCYVIDIHILSILLSDHSNKSVPGSAALCCDCVPVCPADGSTSDISASVAQAMPIQVRNYHKSISENKEIVKLVSVLSTSINSTKKVTSQVVSGCLRLSHIVLDLSSLWAGI